MTSDFWAAIDAQLAEARQATSAAQVCQIMRTDPGPTGRDGFFAGSDDDSLDGALHTAGWSYRWAHAPYHWRMEAPDGSALTYVEGDLYIGDQEAPETDAPTSRHSAPEHSTDPADTPADSLTGSPAHVAAADFPGPPAETSPTPPTASSARAPESSATPPNPDRSPRHGAC